MISATLYSLGESDGILKITSSGASGSVEVKKNRGASQSIRTIVVLDHSGSMGKNVPFIVRQILPLSLRSLGMRSNDIVDMVLFSTNTMHRVMSVSDLEKCPLTADDQTNMTDAVKTVGVLLGGHKHNPTRIIVFSDGAIGDKQQCISEALKIPQKLSDAQRTAPIAVCIIRAMTSEGADPDTQALACLAHLNTSGVVVPHDVDFKLQGEKQLNEAVSTISRNLQDFSAKKIVTIQADKTCMSRVPLEQPQDKIVVMEGTTFLVLSGPAATSINTILVNGEKVEVVKQPLQSEKDVEGLLLFLESHVKMLKVLGQKDEHTLKILEWVGKVQSFIKMDDDEKIDSSIRSRRLQFVKDLSRGQRSVMYRLRALANISRVDKLNSEQQATFLRNVGTGALGKALARRAEKVNDIDLDQEIRKELKAIRDLAGDLSERDDFQSFYSLSSISEHLRDVKKSMSEEDIKEMSVSDMMKLVGPTGIAFSHVQNDAPDPWGLLSIEEVFVGDNSIINASDVWMKQAAGGKFEVPGHPDRHVTGVLPLRFVDVESYQFMLKNCPHLLKSHVSASLRSSLSSMPGDHPAMCAAVAVRLCIQTVNNRTSEASSKALWMVLSDLKAVKHLIASPEMIQAWSSDDPRPYLSGDVRVTSLLKPLAAMLVGLVKPSARFIRALIGYGHYLDCHSEDRHRDIDELLSISEEHDVNVGAPDTPDPVEIKMYRGFKHDVKDSMVPYPQSRTMIHSCLIMASSYEKATDASEFHKMIDPRHLGTILLGEPNMFTHFKMINLALYLQALQSSCQSSRIKVTGEAPPPSNGGPNIVTNPIPMGPGWTREYKFPDVPTAEAAENFISDQVALIYKERYNTALRAKRTAEKELAMVDFVNSLIMAENSMEFIHLLSPEKKDDEENQGESDPVIKDPSSPGYETLEKKIMDLTTDCPHRHSKLYILLTGRRPIADGEIVWNNGNMQTRDMSQYEKVLGEFLWKKLEKNRRENSEHKYRGWEYDQHVPNRHGYGNHHKSFWALYGRQR